MVHLPVFYLVYGTTASYFWKFVKCLLKLFTCVDNLIVNFFFFVIPIVASSMINNVVDTDNFLVCHSGKNISQIDWRADAFDFWIEMIHSLKERLQLFGLFWHLFRAIEEIYACISTFLKPPGIDRSLFNTSWGVCWHIVWNRVNTVFRLWEKTLLCSISAR